MKSQQETTFLKAVEEKISINPSPAFEKEFGLHLIRFLILISKKRVTFFKV